MNSQTNMAISSVCNRLAHLQVSLDDLSRALVSDDTIDADIRIKALYMLQGVHKKAASVQNAFLEPLNLIEDGEQQ